MRTIIRGALLATILASLSLTITNSAAHTEKAERGRARYRRLEFKPSASSNDPGERQSH